MTLDTTLAAASACTLCPLPLGPRPVFQISATARLLIISQAPGTAVHATGIPFNDPSGARLRLWLGLDRATFYDASKIALMPMGFCYPGRLPAGGDAPPRPECAPLWHDKFLAEMPAVQLTLLIGSYAQKRYLGAGTMTTHVKAYRVHPTRVALPHPSWRTIGWEAKSPWFTTEILPDLRRRIAALTA